MKRAARPGLTAVLALAAVVTPRLARAQDAAGPPDGGAPEPPVAAPGPATAPAAASAEGGAVGSGAGLFEQSLASGVAAPSAPATPATSAPAAAAPPFTLTGYVRGTAFVGKVPDFRTAAMKAGYGELSLAVKTARSVYGDGFAEARVRYGVQGGDQQQTLVDLREAYVNTYLGPIDLRFGRQIVVWGRADALNPTNNITPFDLRIRSPIEDDRRLGNFGARSWLRLGLARLEAVWMPLYLPSELPAVGLPEFVSFGPPLYPKAELKEGLVAGRLHLELPAFEMSVSYLRGYAPLPGLTLSGLTFDPVSPQVLVSRTAYQHQVAGFDFSTAIGELVAVRAEAAYRRPADYQNRIYAARPDLQYVLGLDRAFGSVNVIAQYLGRYVIDWRRENGPDQPLDPAILMGQSSPFLEQAVTTAIDLQLARTNQILFSQTERVQHLGTARVEWITAHDTLSLSALALVNFSTREWLLAPRLGYRLSDTLTAYLGAEILAGPDGTLFGLVDELLSAGYAELRLYF